MIDETDTLFKYFKNEFKDYKNSYEYDCIYSAVKEWLKSKKEDSYNLFGGFSVKFTAFEDTKNSFRITLILNVPGYGRSTSFVYSMTKDFDPCDSISYIIFEKYKSLEDETKDSVMISYKAYSELYKIYTQLKDKFEYSEKKIEELLNEISSLKNSYIANYKEAGEYGKALKESQSWKDLYYKEKMEHTSKKARIVFAKHILDGGKSEELIRYFDKENE